MPYWSNPPFLIFDIHEIKNGGLDQYGKVYSLNWIGGEMVNHLLPGVCRHPAHVMKKILDPAI